MIVTVFRNFWMENKVADEIFGSNFNYNVQCWNTFSSPNYVQNGTWYTQQVWFSLNCHELIEILCKFTKIMSVLQKTWKKVVGKSIISWQKNPSTPNLNTENYHISLYDRPDSKYNNHKTITYPDVIPTFIFFDTLKLSHIALW